MEEALTLRRRITEMTDEQRRALDEARRILQPFFAGESVRLHLPKILSEERQARHDRIAHALQLGEDPRAISRREDVSLRTVRHIRVTVVGRIGGKVHP
jgi:formiminotetrahydrofolate cyclodeaminase